MATIKTEGFNVPGSVNAPARPTLNRNFSDGSLAIETDLLVSMHPSSNVPMISPFSFAHSLPDQPSVERFMDSPHPGPASREAGLDSSSSAGFHPASLFGDFKMGQDDADAGFRFSPPTSSEVERSMGSHLHRLSQVGKAPSSKSRPHRKPSMNDSRPPPSSLIARCRSANSSRVSSHHGRTMSQDDMFSNRLGLGMGLDTHAEGEKTDSVSPPDFHLNGAYGVAIPRPPVESSSWSHHRMAPGLVPGSFGSYSGVHDDAFLETPITPAQSLPVNLVTDELYKKQRRRECHNQVEKRRREHINAKIDELSHLLPPHYNAVEEAIDDDEEDEHNHPQGSPMKKKKTKRSGSNAKLPKDTAQCKGRILSQSVQYIDDLRHVTEMQAARIQHLESMLMSTGLNYAPPPMSIQQSSFMWQDAPSTFESFSSQGSVNQHSDLPPLAEHQLEMMRPSPEPESLPPSRQVWEANHLHHEVGSEMPTFGPSPTVLSSASIGDGRSSSLSTTDSIDGDRKPYVGSEGHRSSPGDFPGPHFDDSLGLTRDQQPRKDSDAELQMSMSGMDLDSMFAGNRRVETAGGMRW